MKIAWLLSRLAKTGKPTALAPEDDLGIYRTVGSRPVVLVTVLGTRPELIEEILTVMRRKFEPAYRLVFLTDSTDFAVFRRFSMVFEYLPSGLEQRVHADAMDWHAYLSERWALLLSKWLPLHIVAYGQNVDAFIAAAPRNTKAS